MNTETTPRTYRYFVSFTGSNHAGQVFGWKDLTLAEPITSGAVIEKGQDYLIKITSMIKVTLLTFQRFDTDTDTDADAGAGR
ncbi:hypothetical protein [Couchioplanes caeruleus]|uniref:Uncharacterized protein n=2 Tax=Couchioplanes caeruleus TaxID=56438 RepID=A0A1K0FAB8_9ACTN|nr:hypothetical protein [Couchioplanes caeruleus]OJF09791.1 hypothetical protein BG844_35560 [Couchioplanes caeruleus subsp. caeruleus]ROP31430.1 hypothetical protein EDD30_4331 [Couchioplanes caeruleus]